MIRCKWLRGGCSQQLLGAQQRKCTRAAGRLVSHAAACLLAAALSVQKQSV